MLIAVVHIANLNEFDCKILFFFKVNKLFYLINNNISNFYSSKKENKKAYKFGRIFELFKMYYLKFYIVKFHFLF